MAATAPRYRFGDFWFDPKSGELFRRGRKLRFQNQFAQVLTALVERAGEVVSREDLRERLWNTQTFVDYERGLNKAINGVRAALCDAAARPKYIETLPKKGYRFIAAVDYGAGPGDAAATAIRSLAVLPLVNFSSNPDQEFLADAMTEEVIAAVSKLSALRVISRTSVMRYKGVRRLLPAIARELGVDAILEGSVARAGERVRITVQLIHAPEDRHLWAGRYERELADVLRLQAEIAESVAEQVGQRVEAGPAAEWARAVNAEAYEWCVRGVFVRDKMTPGDLRRSLECFARSIAVDGGYARPYAEMAQAWFFIGVFGMEPSGDAFPKAREAAERALRLDPGLMAAHNALAAVHILYGWDWSRAEAQCREAIRLGPADPVARVHMADFQSIQGRHEEAIQEFRRALAMDPISRVFLAHLGLILYRARRYGEAIEQCRKALDVDPGYANALWFLALALEGEGKTAEAMAQLEAASMVSGGGLHYRALLGRAYGRAGERTKAEGILAELEARAHSGYVSPFDRALVCLGLGDREAAFGWLEEAYRQRVFRLVELTMPMFDDLRGDARWGHLVRRIGLKA